MTNEQKEFMNLLFNQAETVCPSHNKYAYHSVAKEDVDTNKVFLVSENSAIDVKIIDCSDINLISINPINGFRNDANVTAFRSFLIEVDNLPLDQQRAYIEDQLKVPASSCVFSGGKSYHYLITLSEDLPSVAAYRFYSEWILNICSLADQNTKNPSRQTRFPGNIRFDGLKQDLIFLKNRVGQEELFRWMCQHEDKRPVSQIKRQIVPVAFAKKIPPWVQNDLNLGIDTDRNVTWFKHACSCFKNGWELGDLIEYFEQYFEPEADFSKQEWLSTIKSAFKTIRHDEQYNSK
ncbi:MAG: hypothetical protein K1X29_08220 [Bdellovibrionales bacterium]|nr:hypothetical protein [Bdellovibrionales bacterium]